MTTSGTIHPILDRESISTAEGLAIFDSLDVVDIPFMLGRWKGAGINSDHPMDGLLEAANWYGKEFVDADHVHPLLFLDQNNEIIKVAPNPTAMNLTLRFPLPKNALDSKPVQWLFGGLNTLLKTEKSQARLRMMEYRNKVTATMIYDHLPINDSFRKIDENTVLGVMDYKEITQPFFFTLKRV